MCDIKGAGENKVVNQNPVSSARNKRLSLEDLSPPKSLIDKLLCLFEVFCVSRSFNGQENHGANLILHRKQKYQLIIQYLNSVTEFTILTHVTK